MILMMSVVKSILCVSFVLTPTSVVTENKDNSMRKMFEAFLYRR